MLEAIQRYYVMSAKGAKDFLVAVLWGLLQDISFVMPVGLLYLFLGPILNTDAEATPLTLGASIGVGVAIAAVVCVTSYYQYQFSYAKIYGESALRRISLAEKLRKLPLAFFSKKNLSDLTATIMDDATELEHTFSHAVPQLWGSLAMIVIAYVGLCSMDWVLATSIFWVVVAALLALLVAKRFEKRVFETQFVVKRNVSERIQEGIDQVQEIKAYGHVDSYLKKLQNDLQQHEVAQVRTELVVGTLINLIAVIVKLGVPTLVIVGASRYVDGKVSLFTYLFFLAVSSVIYEPLLATLNQAAILFFLRIRLERMEKIVNLPSQPGDRTDSVGEFSIAFENVSFAYESTEAVLDNVSFEAKQGQLTALIGPSGGGKSTCAKLAARFWDTDKGRVTLGGHDIREFDPEELLKYYSIVFQDVVLFDTSVLDNIRIGRRDATDDEVIEAAKLAQCDFVDDLPEGFQTVIGENGSRLSGGERQRISIARAILKNAPIVLLDEATASLDVENESKVQRALTRLTRDKTVIVIAHRMRTIAHADQVVVLDHGKVVEHGAPSQLLKTEDSVFRRMSASQKLLAPAQA